MRPSRILGSILFTSLTVAALAAPPASAPCADPAHRQFDFWVGEWTIYKTDGSVAGTNRIETEYGGCVIHERYSTPGGYTGESLNAYDAQRKVWHQTWVDNSGTLLLLDGKLEGKSMVLSGQTPGAGGITTKHRITWTPNSDGGLRQLWESTDAKGQWTVAFDGLYKKKGSSRI